MSLDTLKSRLNYNGGAVQQDRMNEDKLRSLKKSLLYSYQAATAILSDKREFRCLINPDKLKEDYDNKIISIPFEDVCLSEDREGKTSKGIQTIGMKAGDVFEWKENQSYWLVYLQRLEETAYFRAECRRCRYDVDIDGTSYKCYVDGPTKETVTWHTKNMQNISWSDLMYDATLYITKDELTDKFFHRYGKVEVDGKPWEVLAIDSMSTEGIITVALKEDYKNSTNEIIEEYEAEHPQEEETVDAAEPYISGSTNVKPYDQVTYTVNNATGGTWSIGNSKAIISSSTDTTAIVTISTSRSGSTSIIYSRENEEDIVLNITIESL